MPDVIEDEDLKGLEDSYNGPSYVGNDAGDNQTDGKEDPIDRLKEKNGEGSPGTSGIIGRLRKGAQVTGEFTKTHKKKLGIGGGVAGIILAISLSFFALLPDKIVSIMDNIFQTRVGNKVEYMMQKRADRLIYGYLEQKFGVKLLGGGTYTSSSLVKTLYGNWSTAHFEDKFTSRTGISIEAGEGGKGIVIKTDGVTELSTTDAATFEKYLDGGTLKGTDARKFIRTVVKDQTHWIQLYKRHSLRVFMRNAYGIKKWSWFTDKSGKDATDETTTELVDGAAAPVEAGESAVIECALGTESACPSDVAGDGSGASPTEPEAHSGGGDSTGATSVTDPADSTDATPVGDAPSSIKAGFDKLKTLSPTELAKTSLTKILSTVFTDELSAKISSKAIPIVGQVLLIDQLSRIDHFFRSGQADKALRSVHKVQYATVFAQYLTIRDNFKDPNKKMSGDEVNAIMTRFDNPDPTSPDNNMANSPGFQQDFIGRDAGSHAVPARLGVNDTTTPIKDDYVNSPFSVFGAPLAGWYAVSSTTPLHTLINGLNSAIGFVASQALNALEAAVPQLKGLLADLTGPLTSIITTYLIPPAVDGTEFGANLFNALDIGGAVTGQDFTKSLGAHLVSPLGSAQLQQSIALDQAQNRPGLATQLFSTDYTPSMVNQIAAAMPASPGDAVNRYSSEALAVMRNPFSLVNSLINIITGKAHADNLTNLYGLNDYAYSDAQLNQDISPNVGNCAPEKASSETDGVGDMCQLDTQTAQDLLSSSTSADDGGIGDGSNGSSGSSSCTSGTCNVFLLGDSISVRAENASPSVTSAFNSTGYHLTVDGSVGRSINGAGQSPTTSGMQAVAADQTAISSAQIIIVELGTNFGDDQGSMNALMGAIRAYNPNAKVLWVNVGAMGYSNNRANSISAYNTENALISQLAGNNSYSVVDWCSKVFSGTPCTITPNPVNPGLLDSSDGVHPSIPTGINAYVQMLVSSLSAVGGQ